MSEYKFYAEFCHMRAINNGQMAVEAGIKDTHSLVQSMVGNEGAAIVATAVCECDDLESVFDHIPPVKLIELKDAITKYFKDTLIHTE